MRYWGYLVGYGYLAVLLGIAELLSRRVKRLNREVMRKVLHCLIGMEWLVLNYFFADTWQIVVIPATFIVVNTLSYRFKVFHAIERSKGNHMGTIYYALSMTAMSIATAVYPALMMPFGVAVMCLSFGDAAAALMGTYLKPRIAIFSKSLWGVVGCLAFSWAAQVGLMALLGHPIEWLKITAISVVCALSEVMTVKGTDNIFICLWCMLWAYALYLDNAVTQTVLMFFAGFVLGCVCYNTRSFTLAASFAAAAMLGVVGYIGGWYAFLYVLLAYGVIYMTEHFVKKQHFKERRNLWQVAQNGLCAIILIVIYNWVRQPWLLVAYTIAIAQSLCDSFAGVMGQAFAKQTRDIIHHTPIEKGLSGGVSLVGTLCGLLVCTASMVAVGFMFGWRWYLIVVAALPFLGMLLDSVLGATLQSKQHCTVCGAMCECTAHCSRPTEQAHGLKWLTNGRVNMVCNLLTTAVACAVLPFIYCL